MYGTAFWEQLKLIEEQKENIAGIAACGGALYLFLLLRGRTVYKKVNSAAVFNGIFLSLSFGAILALTLLGREYNPFERSFEFEVFWSYKRGFLQGEGSLAAEVISNILLFIPWGFLLPAAFARFRRLSCIALFSFFISAAIELTQGVFKLGLFEFDDMIGNTLGAALGYLLFRAALRASPGKVKKRPAKR